MEVKAQVKHLRVSPRKARLVVDLVRGMSTEDALNQLRFVNNGVAGAIVKLIKSAEANASHNFKVNKNDLVIKKMWVDEAATLKRWMPRAFGRATPIRKRGSHITVVLGLKDGVKAPVEKTEVSKQEVSKEGKDTKAVAPKEEKKKKAPAKTKEKKATKVDTQKKAVSEKKDTEEKKAKSKDTK